MKFSLRRSFVFCFLIFAFGIETRAQLPVSFSNFTIENGLSQNSVLSITQDSTHFMWFGTRQGLNRYDGYQFKSYRNNPKDSTSLSHNEVSCLLTDHEGTLWIGTAGGLQRYDPVKDAFIRIPAGEQTGLKGNGIESIYEDAERNLWVGTLRGLNLLTNKSKNKFTSFQFNAEKSLFVNGVFSVFKDVYKNIWIGTGNGLLCMSLKNGRYQYKRFTNQKTAGSLSSNFVTAIMADDQQRLWLGTDLGLCLFDYRHQTFTNYRHDDKNTNSLVHNDIRAITKDSKGLLWVSTQEGLSILDPLSMKFSNYVHDPELKTSISHNSIHGVFKDVNNAMWVGTYFGGVNFANPVSTRFTIYQNSKIKPSIAGNIISSIVEDEQHNLWIATEGAGLNYLDRKTHVFKTYKTDPNDPQSITSNLVKIMCRENSGKGELIIGTHHGGLNIFNPATGKFKRILNVKDTTNAIGVAEIVALRQDNYGAIWIGSRNGLSILKRTNGLFPDRTTKSVLDKYINESKRGVQVLFSDQKNNLWVGTASGLYQYNFKSRKLLVFRKNDLASNKLQSDNINCIMETSDGQIGIGTYFGGISLYDPLSHKFKTYQEEDGLSNNNVLGIVEDDDKNLWISTANGLSKLDRKTGKFRTYTRSDGLAGNEFNARSYFKDSNGQIFMGGLNGLSSFYPKEIQTNNYAAPLAFTGLKLFNQPVEVDGPDQLLKTQITNTKSLTFKHDQNHFTLGFALLNYIKSDKNKYAYKLKGYDKDWNYTGQPSATYSNLPAGRYNFLVKGLNNDGVASRNEASLAIKILPPIWASWWAYLFYLLLFSVILFLTVRYFFLRALLKRSEDIQQMKLNFFTSVSHEIRTPLTLILGPLEHLVKSTKDLPEINEQVLPIKNNADRLMRLITELMDFRKTETGNMKLNVSNYNIIPFFDDIFNAFHTLAEDRHIQYSFDYNADVIDLYFDKSQLEKVLFNLLSNAFKFTSNGGQITLSVEEAETEVFVRVRDNGKGIPYESQDKLFSDFFQVDAHGSSHIGSGIGLALSKSIMLAHQGTISIQSTPAGETQSGDTCFTFSLKKGKGHFHPDQMTKTLSYGPSHPIYSNVQSNMVAPEQRITNGARQETILLVEDNPEIRQLLRNLMIQDYEVHESTDGLSGWETAIELLPDLIICDVMMPIMDGLELCRKLKTDERTSHIPIILLTAKSSAIQQLDGMETGADSYVTKPFSFDLLKLNVRNLLQTRANIRQRFSTQTSLQTPTLIGNTVDQAFIAKLTTGIEERMADQDFGVPELAAHIGMSQPVLYKKIRAIADLSVNDFIKSIRLKKAAELFIQNRHNVSEVSYLVGFNDPKYFSREFKKQYGYSPKAYVNSMNQQSSNE